MVELDEISRRLNGIDDRLSKIAETLQAVAVQEERLTNLQSQMSDLWRKVDTIQRTQDKCPIATINRMIWAIFIPMALILLGVSLKTFGVF